MKNRKFKHKEFLRINEIPVSSLPNMLQKRIAGFDELAEDLDHATEEDQTTMKAKINRLDLELEEDLYETYEEILENNEAEQEEEIKEPPKTKEKSNPSSPAPKNQKELSKTLAENQDAKILETLLNKGIISIGRSKLRKLGYKGDLSSKTRKTGPYLLKKALFSYTYYIQYQP